MKERLHVGLIFKGIDGADLTPLGLLKLGFAFVNRFHRMLFMSIPLRGYKKSLKSL